MLSLVFMVCNMSVGQCVTASPKPVFMSEAFCEAAAQSIASDFFLQAKGENVQILYKCVNWGDPA